MKLRLVALALLALASPAFAQTLPAPDFQTQAADNNSTKAATTAFTLGQASNSSPLVNGTVAAGTSTRFSRSDHVHPTDTTRAPATSGTVPLKGNGAGGTAAATAADMATLHGGSATPLVDGAAAAGTSTNFSREDHKHPTDTTRAAATTTVSTSGSLGGGGDLSANRTLTYAGDGVSGTTTPTATSGSTMPGSHSTLIHWKALGTKHYKVNIAWTVATVSPASVAGGFFNVPLPNSTTAAYEQSCSMVDSGGTTNNMVAAYVNGAAATFNLNGLAAKTYVMDCLYEAS